ncbi:hypothetical protein [Vreelandella venusta]|uniref:hypothetical protein n=1 Tax=Vreelandella venusta TaxID=44935 RepID=UPI001168BC07|nr:hypothetical protein [Halomonas venusta]GEK52337.1 hypothetical protein HVE01_30580 [Halomonas venusta]
MSKSTVQDPSYNLPTGGAPYHGADEGEKAAVHSAKQQYCNIAIDNAVADSLSIRTSELRPSDAMSLGIFEENLSPIKVTHPGSASLVETQEATSSGGDNDYWIAEITDPKRLAPCLVECEDLIELFQMSFQEGEAFKALWRNGQMRIGKGKPDDSHLRNAQKVRHFGARMEVIEGRKHAAATAA